MRSVLAIDGGTTSGWALWKNGLQKPRANTLQMPDTDKIGRFCGAMTEWLIPFARLEGVTDIVVESPIVVQHKDRSEGGTCPECGRSDLSINGHEIDRLFGIVHAVELAADMADIPCSRAPRSTVVKHIAGTGRGSRKQFKQYCLLGCQRRGWNVTSEDMADALATLDWFTFDRRIEVPWNNSPAPGPIFETPGVRIEKSNKVAAAVLLNKSLSFNAPDAGNGT